MRHRALAVALGLSVAAGGAAAAAFQQRPVFRAGVETVQVDVVVRDRSGQPVRGLTADDFVILDRGKPQQVVTFEAVQAERPETPSFVSRFPITTKLDVSSNQVAQSRRIVVIVLDDLHGYRGRDEVVKKVARGVVENLGPDALVALLMTSGDFNVELTDDRGRIVDGIEHFKGARLVRRPVQANDERQGSGAGVQPPGRGDQTVVKRDTGPDLQDFDANLRLYHTLEAAGRLFSATDGRRKAFVLISENLAKDLTGVLTARDVAPDAVTGGTEYVAGNLEAMSKARPVPMFHDMAVLEALASLRKSNVATYAIDPRGEITAQDLLRECQPALGFGADPCAGDETNSGPASMSSWVRLAQNGLKQFAEASGGFAIVNSSDFAGGVARIADDLNNYYLLGFNTEDSRTPGFRKLEVQIRNRRDLQVRYRPGYEVGSAITPAAARDPLAAIVSGAIPTANVPLRLTAAAIPGSKNEARVHLAMEITVPRQSLEDPDAALRDDIRYIVTVVDLHGSKIKDVSGSGGRLVLRPRPDGGPAPDTVTYQIGALLNLPPGRYHLRAAASSTKLSEAGSVYLPLDVPDFRKQELGLSALLVGYGTGPRVPTITGVDLSKDKKAIAGAPGPFGLPMTPSLDREFMTTDDVVLYFEVVRKTRTRAVLLDLAVLEYDSHVARRYSQLMPPSSAGKVSVRIPLNLLGPGAFRLRVHATDSVNEAISEVPILIRAAGSSSESGR